MFGRTAPLSPVTLSAEAAEEELDSVWTVASASTSTSTFEDQRPQLCLRERFPCSRSSIAAIGLKGVCVGGLAFSRHPHRGAETTYWLELYLVDIAKQ